MSKIRGKHQALETRTLNNPELQVEQSFTGMDLAGDNDPQLQLSLGQPLRFSDFGRRDKVAELIQKAGDTDKKIKLLELGQKLTIQYYTLNSIEQTQAIIKTAEANAARKVSLINEGLKKGLLSEGDEKLFEGEKYRFHAQSLSLTAYAAKVQSEISKQLGLNCELKTISSYSSSQIPDADILAKKARESEMSITARAKILANLAEEQLKLAEHDVIQQITPRFIYQHSNDGGDFFGAGISMPLPFWNRNQPQQIRSSAENKLQKLNSELLENGSLDIQIKNLRNAAINLQQQAELFQKKVIPSFSAALNSQEKLYMEGKGNVLQVWQTLRTLSDVQTEGIQLWLQAISARSELSILIGEEV